MNNINQSSLVPAISFRVSAESLPKGLDIVGYFCPNPECLCENVTLYFYEADGSFRIKLFMMVINYATWELVSTEVYRDDMDCAKIIHEFVNGLTEDIKSLILSGKEQAVAGIPDLRDDIDYSELSIGNMVCYQDIYRTHPHEQWLFELESAQYLVLDYYCANPKCDCRDVLLIVQTVKDNKTYDLSVLEYRVNFSTETGICQNKDAAVPAELYEYFLEQLENKGIELFKERYLRIKKWGKDYLQNKTRRTNVIPMPVSSMVGRNSPCPCGSGLKYKKCCGR
jgi:hypothetical protein